MNRYGTADASSAARTKLLRRGSASAAMGLRARVPAIRFMLPMRIHLNVEAFHEPKVPIVEWRVSNSEFGTRHSELDTRHFLGSTAPMRVPGRANFP